MSEKPKCFEVALRLIDEANSQDPNTEKFEGEDYPKELLYSMRMTKWLETVEAARFRSPASGGSQSTYTPVGHSSIGLSSRSERISPMADPSLRLSWGESGRNSQKGGLR